MWPESALQHAVRNHPAGACVGGLEDSVIDYSEKGGTGFKFHGYAPDIFVACLERSLAVYSDMRKWKALMRRDMKQDFSVVHMAREYIALYESILADHETVA